MRAHSLEASSISTTEVPSISCTIRSTSRSRHLDEDENLNSDHKRTYYNAYRRAGIDSAATPNPVLLVEATLCGDVDLHLRRMSLTLPQLGFRSFSRAKSCRALDLMHCSIKTATSGSALLMLSCPSQFRHENPPICRGKMKRESLLTASWYSI